MLRKVLSILLILLLLAGQSRALSAQDDVDSDLARADRLIIPVAQQCTRAEPTAILCDFEGTGGFTVSGAGQATADGLFGEHSLSLQLSGSTPAVVKLNVQSLDPSKYTGVVFWAKPSSSDIKVSVGIVSQKGTYTSRSQTLRYSGEALPVYFDFASIGPMANDLGAIKTITLTFTPSSGGDIAVDNVGLADASYGSFNQAWWDEGYGKKFVDQRYQETVNDYLTLLAARGDQGYKDAIIRGMDNIVLSRQPDGWVEAATTGMITAGTLGSTLANAYIALKNDPAMDERIDVYGDASHTRRYWVEKTLDLDVAFIDDLFSMNPNNWIVRNQLMEGARATYCAYLATGKAGYLDDYKNMMATIKAGRQDPLGIYPEWSKSYNTGTVMYDASYSAVQLSILLSLSALGDREYALPMAKDLYGTLESAIDPKTGMVLNLNSSRKELEGDLRWQDGLLYYLGTKESVPGFVHLGYLENRVSPGKAFPENFHSALARYYDLKYYAYPAEDNGYLLPLEYPAYSVDVLDLAGNIVSTKSAYISADGSITNPALSRDQTTFIRVNGFGGKITPSQDVEAWFEGGSVYLKGSGPVTVSYSGPGGALERTVTLNGALELRLGDGGQATVAPPSAAAANDLSKVGVSSLATGTAVFALVLALAAAAILLQKKRKS